MAQKQSIVKSILPVCDRLANQTGLELVDVAIEKENTGNYLRIYLNKEGGLTLDDCENYHRQIAPLVEKYDYDFLEVSSPGIDRPLKTERDIMRNIGAEVDVRLYKPVDGQKSVQGALVKMDKESVVVKQQEIEISFPRSAVALVKLVPDLSALEEMEMNN